MADAQSTDPSALLAHKLSILFRLNPETAHLAAPGLYELAREVSAERFEEFAILAGKLVDAYLGSPWKHAEKLVLAEYFDYFERSTRLLQERGEVSAEVPALPAEQRSVALVNPRLYSSLDWCRVSTAANVPLPLQRSIDACVRRNRLLSSVLEVMFTVLHHIDPKQAVAWELGFLESNRGGLDPDIVRDLIRAWSLEPELPSAAFAWALSWSVDENLARQWPAVVAEADALLRRHALRLWLGREGARTGRLGHLKMLSDNLKDDTSGLYRWLESAMAGMSENVDFFVKLGQGGGKVSSLDGDSWVQAALFRELQAVESTFVPILILADLILARPSGANRFALAVFGLSEDGHCAWSHKIRLQSKKIVLRLFLNGLRLRIPPEETIRSLCFRDSQLFVKTVGELDLITRQFDSLRQRDKVVDKLAVYYASFREAQLIQHEISQRYRQLMRVVHEDSLRRLFSAELVQKMAGMATLFSDLAGISSEARHFLNKRRSPDAALEEIAAAELDFARTIRQRRKSLIHRILARG